MSQQMEPSAPGEVTAAEIAASLGIDLYGRVECRTRAVGPDHTTADTLRGQAVVLAMAALLVISGLARLTRLAQCLGLLMWLTIGYLLWRQANRTPLRRPAEADAEEALTALVATAYGLQLRIGGGWREVPWSAVVQRGDQLQAAGFDLRRLPRRKHVARVLRAAEMIVARRAAAGPVGLRFPDEATDTSLSLARPADDEADAERGLSQVSE